MDLKPQVDAVMPRVHELRWQIHQHPELSLQEEQTAALVERELMDVGLIPERFANTGVVAVLRGNQAGQLP